jgi:hypothetical protein
MTDHMTLTALLLRLKQYHPRHQAELLALERLLDACGITDEVFAEALKHRPLQTVDGSAPEQGGTVPLWKQIFDQANAQTHKSAYPLSAADSSSR